MIYVAHCDVNPKRAVCIGALRTAIAQSCSRGRQSVRGWCIFANRGAKSAVHTLETLDKLKLI